ncbi:FMN-binding glutamate synthase family protein [Paenibacillus sp. IB182496]|uniref:FMN-binding glutamate synthase family protein n=1 Tax=Paenibacillus sabuli TaxID=2772509 RepID=A0A927BZ01_9BACL|nr:FMN-binding glutamate synthase family protein [Paenibacillus sabuli]MBD2848089.1 FMN-binding glutamate synthase family protein [Paenibacillus sabuli]
MEAILILLSVIVALLLVPAALLLWLYLHDKAQTEHSVLRNYPVLGKLRYLIEKMGPELRQYLFNNDREGKPFNRREFEFVNKAGKYADRMLGFGAERDYEQGGYYLANAMFPVQDEDLKRERERQRPVDTYLYTIDKSELFSRKEHRHPAQLDPAYLQESEWVVLGAGTARQPFRVKGLIGQSAMSYGSLGSRAITALSRGLARAGGTWMNTGEGSVSPYHLEGGADLIMQISSGLFGVRTEDGAFAMDQFRQQAQRPQIKAFELKLGQGAKTRGGHVDGKKITAEIAAIRNIPQGQDVDSPNRFPDIATPEALLRFVHELREEGGKPVGIKIVVGSELDADRLVAAMQETDIVPDFVTVDGSEGGTGASYYELAYSVGLPAFAAVPLVDDLLRRYGLRARTKLIASGKLITPDKIAMALALGADLVNIARGFMISVGCIMSQVCHTNTCPVGVATTDPKLERALTVEEKEYRVANYLITLREGLFELAAVAGLDSPTQFTRAHLVYDDAFTRRTRLQAGGAGATVEPGGAAATKGSGVGD